MNNELKEAKYILNELLEQRYEKEIKTTNLFESIETVLKEVERLQEENKNLKKANREKADRLIEITNLYLDAIPKENIKNKIIELKNKKEYYQMFPEDYLAEIGISILQELMEEK